MTPLLELLGDWAGALGVLPGEVRRRQAERRANETCRSLRYALFKRLGLESKWTAVLPFWGVSRLLAYDARVEVKEEALAALAGWRVTIRLPFDPEPSYPYRRQVPTAKLERTTDGGTWQPLNSKDLTEPVQIDRIANWASELIERDREEVIRGLEQALSRVGVEVGSRYQDAVDAIPDSCTGWYLFIEKPKPPMGDYFVILAGRTLQVDVAGEEGSGSVEPLARTELGAWATSDEVARWVRSEIERHCDNRTGGRGPL